jgi:transmembrane Fragile-X-F protein
MSKESSSSSGIGFAGMLCILFIGLKLTHVIDWSWWWITSPLWIPALIVVGILAVYRVILILERREKKPIKFEAPKEQGIPANKSKFMNKLNEAMAESERKRSEGNRN